VPNPNSQIGVSLADTAIQPGVEVSVGDFTVGGWFSTGVGETSALALDESLR